MTVAPFASTFMKVGGHEVLRAQGIPVQGTGRQAYRS